MKELINSKGFKIFKVVLKVLLIIVLIGFVFSVFLQRFSNNRVSIFNYRMFTVVTGSMKPKYDIGDVLLAKEVDPETIEIGDTISYLGYSGSFNGKVITHKVVDIERDEKTNKLVFHTQGLTNVIEDPEVPQDLVYGKVVYKSLILSLVYKIVSTNIGFYLFIIIPILYIIISEIISTLINKEEKKRNLKQGSD